MLLTVDGLLDVKQTEMLALETPRVRQVAAQLGMTEETVQEYRQAFQLFDTDGDGSVTLDELTKVMRSLGRDLSREELQEMLDQFDHDSDGVIEFPEFLAAISKITNDVESPEELVEIFRVIDQDGDGCISRADLRHVCVGIGMSLTNQEMEDMFDAADHDTDDNIDFEDYMDCNRDY